MNDGVGHRYVESLVVFSEAFDVWRRPKLMRGPGGDAGASWSSVRWACGGLVESFERPAGDVCTRGGSAGSGSRELESKGGRN